VTDLHETPVSSPEAPSTRSVSRCAIVTHGEPERTREALGQVVEVARAAGVQLVLPADEVAKHPEAARKAETWSRPGDDCDLALVLGGDGTMIRTLQRFLDTEVPVIGVNFGRVGFLTSLQAEEIPARLGDVFAGEYELVTLPTIDVVHHGRTHVAVNDVLVTSAVQGRMAVLEWEINRVPMGERGCDGIVVTTPVGSTGYNLSAGGPVMGWGVDAMVVTFVAPHALDARPLVLSRGHRIRVASRSSGFASRLVVDGHVVGSLEEGADVRVSMGAATALLATLADRPFLSRYRDTFSR
jgi:NAD+ kinase